MLSALRWLASVGILLWGVLVVLLGIVTPNLVWIMIGLVILAVGVPFLAALPFAARRLYPPAEGPSATR